MKIWRNYGLFFKYFKILRGRGGFFSRKKIIENQRMLKITNRSVTTRSKHYAICNVKSQVFRTNLTWDLTFPVRWPDWKSANSRKQGYSNVIRNFLIYPSLLDLSKIYRGLLVLDRWLTFLDHPCWRPLQEDKACFYYIQSFQDWICCPRTIPVCVCMRACVHVSVPACMRVCVHACKRAWGVRSETLNI